MKCAVPCDAILLRVCLEASKSCNAVICAPTQVYKNVQALVSENSHLLEQSYSNACTKMAPDFLTNLENKTTVFSPSLFQSISAEMPPTDL